MFKNIAAGFGRSTPLVECFLGGFGRLGQLAVVFVVLTALSINFDIGDPLHNRGEHWSGWPDLQLTVVELVAQRPDDLAATENTFIRPGRGIDPPL